MRDSFNIERPNVVTESQPNRWDEVTLPFYASVALGNMTQQKVAMMAVPGPRLFVGVETKGAYTFEDYVHWAYLAEKMKLGESDARNLADFINSQLAVDYQEQGTYYDHLLLTKSI